LKGKSCFFLSLQFGYIVAFGTRNQADTGLSQQTAAVEHRLLGLELQIPDTVSLFNEIKSSYSFHIIKLYINKWILFNFEDTWTE
jgi:hypothetical protein